MQDNVNNLRVLGFDPLIEPQAIRQELPLSDVAREVVVRSRQSLQAAITGDDERLIVVAGPCSVHDPDAALEYARKLAAVAHDVASRILVVMRVYFEKPRTTLGWKGLINDPHLDGSHDVNAGLRKARRLLLAINELGLPCATEFLDPVVPQYTAELVSWAAVGARTTESQTHREMASGLSMPVGFKNATDGGLQIALDALVTSQHSHAFLGVGPAGRVCVVRTRGNPDVHLVLRGGGGATNFSRADLAYARIKVEELGFTGRRILVDCSHGNSRKDYRRQPAVFAALLEQFVAGERALLGMMLESNLVAGAQKMETGGTLVYGQSVTDACIDWPTTEALLTSAYARISC